jgi:hypothetical protein
LQYKRPHFDPKRLYAGYQKGIPKKNPPARNKIKNSKICLTICAHLTMYFACILNLVKSREVFERGVEFFGEENMDEKLFVAFAKFEEACKEVTICELV